MIEKGDYCAPGGLGLLDKYGWRVATDPHRTHRVTLASDIERRRDWCEKNLPKGSFYDRWYRDAMGCERTFITHYFIFKSYKDATHFLLCWGT